MPRLFSLINEMDERAWRILPALLVLADDVVLWAPGGTALAQLKAKDRVPFGPDDILKLIEHGAIKIAAREDFIEDKVFRNSSKRWEGQWWSDFDDKILALKKFEDRTKPRNPSVLVLEKEIGYHKADQLSNRDPQYQLARRLLKENRIPNGTAERIQRFRAQKEGKWARYPTHMAVREILRDAYNREDARAATGSHVAVDPAPFPVIEFNRIAEVKPNNREDVLIDRKEAAEFLKWVGSLPYAKDVETILELRSDSRQRELFWQIVHSSRSPFAELENQLQSEISRVGLWEELLGPNPSVRAGTVIGLASAVASALVTRRWVCVAGLAVTGGLFGAALPVADAELRRSSIFPDGTIRDSDARWPFLLAFGTTKPTRNQILALHREVQKRLLL